MCIAEGVIAPPHPAQLYFIMNSINYIFFCSFLRYVPPLQMTMSLLRVVHGGAMICRAVAPAGAGTLTALGLFDTVSYHVCINIHICTYHVL